MQLSIAHRLILGFSILILLAIGTGWYQLASLREMRDFAVRTAENDFDALQLLRRIGLNQRDMTAARERAVAAPSPIKASVAGADRTSAQREWQLSRDRTLAFIAELETFAAARQRNASSLDRAELWTKVRENTRETRQVLSEIASVVVAEFEAINSGKSDGASVEREVLSELLQKFARIGDRTEDLASDLAARAKRDIAELHADVNQTTIAALVAISVLGIVLAVVIYRSITRPLGAFMEFVGAVGQGDLTQRTGNTGTDELGRLGAYLNDMVENLAAITQQTRTTAENLNAATAEMQSSAQQQAASTSEQSAAVQQITSTLEEIAQSGNQISDRAKTVATSAEAASTASKSGLDAVSETGRAIRAIREQAERVAGTVVALTEKTQSVGEIIASVNEIAERSNLLALNAAIEASAAGEEGRSFAVVAEEIKNLADQAKEATGQVHGLLSEIQQGINSAVMQTEEAVKRAEYGSSQSEQTERTITNLARSVEQSVATFQQILAATNQQQIGVEQVSDSVRNIREASEQIAAGINELERAAGSMNALSSQLRQSIERYRL